jgi:hypothetical protein
MSRGTSPYTITVEGMEALQRKLGSALEPVAPIIREAGIFARTKAAQYAKPHPADTGGLGAAITVRFIAPGQFGATAEPLEAIISPLNRLRGLAETVEYGTEQSSWGAYVPMKALTRWARRHGYIGPKESAWHIEQLIIQRGIKGVHMFEHAAHDTEAKVKELVTAAVSAIERKWGS